jgi:hypothetical protein
MIQKILGKKPPANTLFAWLISHQPTILFPQNKPATSNQPPVLFSQNKPASATSQTNMPQANQSTGKGSVGAVDAVNSDPATASSGSGDP